MFQKLLSQKLHRRTILFGLGLLLPNLATVLSSCNRQPQATPSQPSGSTQNTSAQTTAPDRVTLAYNLDWATSVLRS